MLFYGYIACVCAASCCCFFFFKQKTAYEMRISDLSSDVGSSDLGKLRNLVEVRHLNLAAPFPVLPSFDIVFLRNVLIYFDLDTKRDILSRMHQVTASDGYLLLGSTETTLDMETHWERESAGRVQLHRPSGHAPAGAPTSRVAAAPRPQQTVLTGA